MIITIKVEQISQCQLFAEMEAQWCGAETWHDAGGDSLVLGRLSRYLKPHHQGVQSSPVTPGNAVTTTLGSQVAPRADPLPPPPPPHTRPLAGTWLSLALLLLNTLAQRAGEGVEERREEEKEDVLMMIYLISPRLSRLYYVVL